MTNPLGWSIIPQMLIRRERWPGGLRTRGVALVNSGQKVQPDQPVIRLEKTDSSDQKEGIVLAGVGGKVIDITQRGGVIIETRAAIIQGTIGVGNQVVGILTIWNSNSRSQFSSAIPTNISQGAVPSLPTILAVPGPLNLALLRQAMHAGVAGIVASSISSRDLEGFLGADLIALINNTDIELAYAHLPPFTLLLTEGPGTVAMPARTITMLSRFQGSMVLLSGATSIRQSVYPELIITLPVQELQQNWRPEQPDPTLTLGSQVRICSGSYEGTIGEIIYFYIYQQTFESGVRSRAARVRLEDGSTLVMPLNLLERIG